MKQFDDFFPQHLRFRGFLLKKRKKKKNLKSLRDLTGADWEMSCTEDDRQSLGKELG